jgi:light-regulated signal transduction histidine kinase (bacteriophytochrome)
VKERTSELELRNRELEQFTYVSHHDLQEPLRKILIFADMVKAEAAEKLSEASRNRLERVSHAAQRMKAALTDLLHYASLDKKEESGEVDLDEVLATVQVDLELMIAEKSAKIISDNLPTIFAVPRQMHQLFYNLLNNALKFSRRGVQPVIRISCSVLPLAATAEFPDLNQHRNYYQISVEDNGIGFPADLSVKIFDMFQRLHSKEEYEGTGIGLALCKKVVLNHGGRIWAESGDGEGTIFKLLLPVG